MSTKVKISEDLKEYCKINLRSGCGECVVRQECHTPCRMSYQAIDEKISKMNKLIEDVKNNTLSHYA
jgi:hypothetical protein